MDESWENRTPSPYYISSDICFSPKSYYSVYFWFTKCLKSGKTKSNLIPTAMSETETPIFFQIRSRLFISSRRHHRGPGRPAEALGDQAVAGSWSRADTPPRPHHPFLGILGLAEASSTTGVLCPWCSLESSELFNTTEAWTLGTQWINQNL